MDKETNKKNKKNSVIKYLAATCFLAAALAYLFFGPTAVRQNINLRNAREHIKVLEKATSEYPEFDKVILTWYTGAGGCIIIMGEISSERDAELLVKVIQDTKPPVTVKYYIRIGDTENLFRGLVNEDK